jgi:Flp pilus assembly protein TadD
VRLRPGDSEARALLDDVASVAANASVKPLERIKRNYDETSFRQLALEIANATELSLAKRDPATHALAHIERGRQLMDEGFADEAARQFREAMSLAPGDAEAHAALAAVLEREGDLKGAHAEAESALKLKPSAAAYAVLGRLEFASNHLEAAMAYVTKALMIEPANAEAQQLRRDIDAKQTATTEAPK